MSIVREVADAVGLDIRTGHVGDFLGKFLAPIATKIAVAKRIDFFSYAYRGAA